MRYKKHVFICTNERASDARPSCGEEHGMALVTAFKQSLVQHGLKGIVRAQRTGCCDVCEYGPTVVVYPEGTFYGNVQLSDVPEIIDSHILNDQPVDRLIMDFSKPGHKDPAQ